ncbi:MAG: hypothetical protein WAT58_13060, partial [Candidatus Dormiibacterota bacterium]
LRGRAEAVGKAAAHPEQTVKKAEVAVENMADDTRERIKAELRQELKKELDLQDREPMREKIVSTALKTAATTAIPIIIRQLEKRAR